MTNARWNFARTVPWICTPELLQLHSPGEGTRPYIFIAGSAIELDFCCWDIG